MTDHVKNPAIPAGTKPGGGEGRPSNFGTPRPYKTPAEKAREKTRGVGGVAHSIFKPKKAMETPKTMPEPNVVMASKICSKCGTASATPEMPGDKRIEIVLWLCYIVPGLIYSIWRRSKKSEVCPACGSKDLLPIDTPAGQKMLKEHHPEGVPTTVLIPTPPKPVSKITVFGVLLLVAFMIYTMGGFRS